MASFLRALAYAAVFAFGIWALLTYGVPEVRAQISTNGRSTKEVYPDVYTVGLPVSPDLCDNARKGASVAVKVDGKIKFIRECVPKLPTHEEIAVKNKATVPLNIPGAIVAPMGKFSDRVE